MADEEKRFLQFEELDFQALNALAACGAVNLDEDLPDACWRPTGMRTGQEVNRNYYQFEYVFSSVSQQIENSAKTSFGRHGKQEELSKLLTGCLHDFRSRKISLTECIDGIENKEVRAALYLLLGNLLDAAFIIGTLDKTDIAAVIQNHSRMANARAGIARRSEKRKRGHLARLAALGPKVAPLLAEDPTIDAQKIFRELYGHLPSEAKERKRRNAMRHIQAIIDEVRSVRRSI